MLCVEPDANQFGTRPDVLLVAAPAKLNLFLNVVRRRTDGYHDLETLMVAVGLYDTLRLTRTASPEFELRTHFVGTPAAVGGRFDSPPNDPSNLVWKAAQLLRETFGCTLGARVELFKRIPVAAGLAGGSSNAAAALCGLNRLWNLGASRGHLLELASRIGSDVPFFLGESPAAVCTGRGERLAPAEVPGGLSLVIAKPPSGLSTPEVFRHCTPEGDRPGVLPLIADLRGGRLSAAARRFHNSLQAPAQRLNPEVGRLRAAFSSLPFVGHLMSGSGTSYFGLCHSRTQALRLAGILRAWRLGSVYVAQTCP